MHNPAIMPLFDILVGRLLLDDANQAFRAEPLRVRLKLEEDCPPYWFRLVKDEFTGVEYVAVPLEGVPHVGCLPR